MSKKFLEVFQIFSSVFCHMSQRKSEKSEEKREVHPSLFPDDFQISDFFGHRPPKTIQKSEKTEKKGCICRASVISQSSHEQRCVAVPGDTLLTTENHRKKIRQVRVM